MALITIDRSLFASKTDDCDVTGPSSAVDASDNSSRSSHSEDFMTCKATVIGLNIHSKRRSSIIQPNDEIQDHLKEILGLLRFGDYIQLIVRLQCEFFRPHRHRYCCVVSTTGKQGTEESIILGVDITDRCATVGLVLPIWQDMSVSLCGDGGFELITKETEKLFKPVSVQALWAAFQAVDRACSVARSNAYFSRGLTHDWVVYYQNLPLSETYQIQEWLKTDDIDNFNRCLPLLSCLSLNATEEEKETVRVKELIRTKLQEIMYTVDLEEVTVLQLRKRLEDELGESLHAYRHFIEAEVLRIYGQMDESSEIFPHLFLGTTFNASNRTELVKRSVTHILNVTREVDNFFPGEGYQYKNIRVFDDEQSSLLPFFEDAHRFINEAKTLGTSCLVHCKMGISRSASVVIAYTMKEENMDLDTALAFVKARRQCIQPNSGFMRELRIYEGILEASANRAIFCQDPTPIVKAAATTQPASTTVTVLGIPTNCPPVALNNSPPTDHVQPGLPVQASTVGPVLNPMVSTGDDVPTADIGNAERLDLESELFVYKQFRHTADTFEIVAPIDPVDADGLGVQQTQTDKDNIKANLHGGGPHDVLDLGRIDEERRLKNVTIVAQNSHCLRQWHPDLVEKVELSDSRPTHILPASLQLPPRQVMQQRSLSPILSRRSNCAVVNDSLSLSPGVHPHHKHVSYPAEWRTVGQYRGSLSEGSSLRQSSASDSGFKTCNQDGGCDTRNFKSESIQPQSTLQPSSFVLKMAAKLTDTSAVKLSTSPSATKGTGAHSSVGYRQDIQHTISGSHNRVFSLTAGHHRISSPERSTRTSADLISTSVNNCLEGVPKAYTQVRHDSSSPLHQRSNSSRMSAPVSSSTSHYNPIGRSQSARQAAIVSSRKSSLLCRLRPDNSWIVHGTTPNVQLNADVIEHKIPQASCPRPHRRLRPKSTLPDAYSSIMNQCLHSSRSNEDLQLNFRIMNDICCLKTPPRAQNDQTYPSPARMYSSGDDKRTSELTNVPVTTDASGSSATATSQYGIFRSSPLSAYQSLESWSSGMLDPVATQSSC